MINDENLQTEAILQQQQHHDKQVLSACSRRLSNGRGDFLFYFFSN